MDSSFDELELPVETGEIIPATGEVADEHTFKILIATDIHLGYCDNNTARENDSFNTFEEILQLGVSNEVDFVLLGGDLFHENKPRPNVLQKTTELLRKYCLGDRPVAFQYVGDPKRDFPNQDEPEVNYYNANINIGLPVFTIHGNHDDPIGNTKTSAVDHLAAAKLLNHFGQWDSLNKVSVSPVLFTKGDTKLALYGLGHLKDDRLHRLIYDNKVTYIGPSEDQDVWFNLFVLHQNRVKHGPKNYIPENFIPGFMDLVLWGHEHECRIKQELAEGLVKTYITQPGSSVATSLSQGEGVEKQVAILKVNRRRFRIEPIKLQTVRPLVMKDVLVKEVLESSPKNTKDKGKYLEKYVDGVVESLIKDAEDKLTGHEKQPVQPLVRVRVFHDDVEDTFNPIRFSQKYADKVANDDIILFKKLIGKREGGFGEIDADEIGQLMMDQDDDDLDSHVESIVETYFNKARERGEKSALLEVLSEKGLSEAVKSAVEKNDVQAISVVIESQMDKVIEYLVKQRVTEDTAEDHLEEFRNKRAGQTDQELNELLSKRKPKIPNEKKQKASNGSIGESDEENGDVNDDESPVEILDDDDDDNASTTSSRSRGGRGSRGSTTRGRGSTARGGRGRGRGKARADESASPPPTTSRARGGRGANSGSRGSKSKNDKGLIQTTLNIRRSPRKGSQAMVFDLDDDSD